MRQIGTAAAASTSQGGAARMRALRAGARGCLRARAARCLATPRPWRAGAALHATVPLHAAASGAPPLGSSVVTRASPVPTAAEAPAALPGGQYPFREVEERWQRYWEENATFRTPADVDLTKPKYYALDMFPYPRCASASYDAWVLGPVPG
jgi:hypothetical protein